MTASLLSHFLSPFNDWQGHFKMQSLGFADSLICLPVEISKAQIDQQLLALWQTSVPIWA